MTHQNKCTLPSKMEPLLTLVYRTQIWSLPRDSTFFSSFLLAEGIAIASTIGIYAYNNIGLPEWDQHFLRTTCLIQCPQQQNFWVQSYKRTQKPYDLLLVQVL